MQYSKQLNDILMGEGKENPQLGTGAWAALSAFYGLPQNERKAYFEQAIRDPRSSEAFIRAMRAILAA